ncbi:MAG: hypothetical protein U9Q80_06275 [Bacillota bacterium]|nr:hypothetical protein [Bacillota bacterium]
MKYNYDEIEKLEASVGGYFGTSFDVTIDFKLNLFEWSSVEHSVESMPKSKKGHIDFTKVEKSKFIATNILCWKDRYENELRIMDGTSWGVKITFKDHLIQKSGSNSFPNEWSLFCKFIEEITGESFR